MVLVEADVEGEGDLEGADDGGSGGGGFLAFQANLSIFTYRVNCFA